MVETRGRQLTLQPNPQNGLTDVIADEPINDAGGLTVRISARQLNLSSWLGDKAIAIACHGKQYNGRTLPHWYGAADILRMLQDVTPASTTVREMCRHIFDISVADDRRASDIVLADATQILQTLRASSKPLSPASLGEVGPGFGKYLEQEHYAAVRGTAVFLSGAEVPFVVEAWATCSRPDERGRGWSFDVDLSLNRTPSISRIHATSYSDCIEIAGCGLATRISGTKIGLYKITLSLITPYIELVTDGKSPALSPFRAGIYAAIKKVANAAHRAIGSPPRKVTIKDAAGNVMAMSYHRASDGGRLPATGRQVMYAARPHILKATGRDRLDDVYFTQTLLPNYVNEHPDETRDWDVVFDARGLFVEPHTGREVPLSTIDVRAYLGERAPLGLAISLSLSQLGGLFPTSGPKGRYRNVLFIEKEGFGPLLRAANIANRFDIAIMSTKGMSVVAARHLLDRLAPHIDKVLVMHDYDVSGFSIFGTLHSSGRRYGFTNKLNVVDIGLRGADVDALNLQSEPVQTSGDWRARENTLRRHGATKDEIAFLAHRRVELNAMTSDVFVRFLEEKLIQHGVEKVVPDQDTIVAHARRVVAQRLMEKEMSGLVSRIEAEAASALMPADLRQQVTDLLKRQPDMPWDDAVAHLLEESAA